MENSLKKRLVLLQDDVAKAWERLRIDNKIDEIAKLEAEVANPEIWHDPNYAREQNEKLAKLNDETQDWKLLKMQTEDLRELIALDDKTLTNEISTQLDALETNLANLKKSLRFTGKYDHHDAILRITAGVG